MGFFIDRLKQPCIVLRYLVRDLPTSIGRHKQIKFTVSARHPYGHFQFLCLMFIVLRHNIHATDKHSDSVRFHEHNRLCTQKIAQWNRAPAVKMIVAQPFTKFAVFCISKIYYIKKNPATGSFNWTGCIQYTF